MNSNKPTLPHEQEGCPRTRPNPEETSPSPSLPSKHRTMLIDQYQSGVQQWQAGQWAHAKTHFQSVLQLLQQDLLEQQEEQEQQQLERNGIGHTSNSRYSNDSHVHPGFPLLVPKALLNEESSSWLFMSGPTTCNNVKGSFLPYIKAFGIHTMKVSGAPTPTTASSHDDPTASSAHQQDEIPVLLVTCATLYNLALTFHCQALQTLRQQNALQGGNCDYSRGSRDGNGTSLSAATLLVRALSLYKLVLHTLNDKDDGGQENSAQAAVAKAGPTSTAITTTSSNLDEPLAFLRLVALNNMTHIHTLRTGQAQDDADRVENDDDGEEEEDETFATRLHAMSRAYQALVLLSSQPNQQRHAEHVPFSPWSPLTTDWQAFFELNLWAAAALLSPSTTTFQNTGTIPKRHYH